MRRAWLAVAVTALAVSGCNLAGDVTPPPGASAPAFPPAGTAVAASNPAIPPETAPDLVKGQEIYRDRCAPCHGDQGMGDGPQAGDLPVAPAELADSELADEAAPADWYQVVTNGRLARFMPPFSSLSDQERWDVVGYALGLSRPAAADEGQGLYRRHCADCHGVDGRGASGGPSLVDGFADRSRTGIEAAIADGMGEAMPAFGDVLAADERAALAYFIQELAWTTGETERAAAGPAEPDEPAESTVAIRGTVLNGTDGQPVDGDLEVDLHAFDGQERVFEASDQIGPGAAFAFNDLETAAGRLFIVTAEYDGILYSSEVVHLEPASGTRELPLIVYESTNDPSQVRARRLHLLIDQPLDGSLHAVELWVLANLGDRTVVPVDGAGGVEIRLPEGATNLRFEDTLLAERYQATEAGFRLLTPLRPGGEGAQIVFSFDLAAEGGLDFRQSMTIPVEAITVLVAENGPRLTGAGVVDRGVRQAAGQELRQYDLGPIPGGQRLELRLEGPSIWRNLLPQSVGSTWAIGLAALLVAAGAVAWWYRPWISGEGPPEERNEPSPTRGLDRKSQLLAAIAELDAAYDQGGLDEGPYQRRRRELKDQLVDLMLEPDD